MSYILEALRKADAERERAAGTVPGLGSQPVPLAVVSGGDGAASRPWVWLVAGVGLALGAVALWPSTDDRVTGVGASAPAPAVTPPAAEPSPPPPVAAPTAPSPAAATAAPAPPPRPAAGPKAAAPAPATTPTTTPAARSATSKPPVTAASAVQATPRAAADSAAETAPQATTARPSRGSAAPASAPAATPADVRLPTARELPEDVRRDLPPMNVGGSVYSPQPASRLVILNGQVVREGDTVAPGLVMEKIGQKAATMNLRGQRFLLPYAP